jgi:hypothetical protein
MSAFCAISPFFRLSALVLLLTGCSRTTDPPTGVAPASDSVPFAPGLAAPSAQAPEGSLTEDRRQRLLAAMLPLIEAHYVLPEVGMKAAAALREHAARGDYASLTVESDFARHVTDDLREVSHDLHFRVRHASDKKKGTKAEQEAEAAIEAKFGFVAVEHLPGNIAILRVDSFRHSPDETGVLPAYAQNMTQVAGASALILDLRENYGGDPATVSLLLSYVFDRTPVHVNDIQGREDVHPWQLWTRAQVPGKRFGGTKPVFVLISKRTISGGEEAAYDLQAQKRATLIGETTAGAANPAPMYPLDDGFVIFVPAARAINPITHTNWEGTGVVPDVAVDPELALDEALARARRALGLDGG